MRRKANRCVTKGARALAHQAGARNPRRMARRPRIIEPNGIYHVTSRGNRKQEIVVDTRDYLRFRELLAATVERYELVLHAWCVLSNHFHLVVQVPHANLSAAMQWFKGTQAQKVNWRHGLQDHVYGRRFGARHIRSDGDFINVCEYVLANPAEAGIVELPEEYFWSSCASTLGLALPQPFVTTDMLLALLHPDVEEARAILARRLRARIERSRRAFMESGPPPWDIAA
jgi:putative transposase